MKNLILLLALTVLVLSCKKEHYTPEVYQVELESVFDAETVKISKDNFDATGIDFSIEVWYYLNSEWVLMPITEGAGGANVKTYNGDVFVCLNMAPASESLPVKIVLMR